MSGSPDHKKNMKNCRFVLTIVAALIALCGTNLAQARKSTADYKPVMAVVRADSADNMPLTIRVDLCGDRVKTFYFSRGSKGGSVDTVSVTDKHYGVSYASDQDTTYRIVFGKTVDDTRTFASDWVGENEYPITLSRKSLVIDMFMLYDRVVALSPRAQQLVQVPLSEDEYQLVLSLR